MKRIDVHYGGQIYSVGGRSLEEFKAEIEAGLTSGGYWLVVNDGEGERRDAHLLVTAATALALVPIPDPSESESSATGAEAVATEDS